MDQDGTRMHTHSDLTRLWLRQFIFPTTAVWIKQCRSHQLLSSLQKRNGSRSLKTSAFCCGCLCTWCSSFTSQTTCSWLLKHSSGSKCFTPSDLGCREFHYPHPHKITGTRALGRSRDTAACEVQVSILENHAVAIIQPSLTFPLCPALAVCYKKETPSTSRRCLKAFLRSSFVFTVKVQLRGGRKTALVFSFVFISQEKKISNH